MRTDPLYILAVLSLLIAVSDVLVRRTWLRHAGTALVVILVTAVAANLGVLPAGSSTTAPVPVYDGIFAYVAPLAIFWLLLLVNLRDVLRAGLPIIALFLIGAFGVVVGAFVAAAAFPFDSPLFAPVAGMFVGTYIGGSINFNAVALSYGVVRDGVLYAGSVAVDNVVTTIWMVATLAAPRLLAPLWSRQVRATAPIDTSDAAGIVADTESVHPLDLALLGTLGLASLLISGMVAARTGVPAIIVVTTLALLLAQLPLIGRLRGARVLGMFAVYLFLAVIGAFCDVRQLAALGAGDDASRWKTARGIDAVVAIAPHEGIDGQRGFHRHRIPRQRRTGRHRERERSNPARSDPREGTALADRLAHAAEIGRLQVAQAAVNRLEMVE